MASSSSAGPDGRKGWAERVDGLAGLRERAAFFGEGAERMFGVTHSPLAPTDRGMVVCASLNQDMAKNYRREVVLARAMVARGIAVQRFQYVGSGNSDGDYASISFESMVRDALAAAQCLEAHTGARRVAFFGGRFGALVAAAAAARFPGAPTVFLEPINDGMRFFREGIRTKVAQEMVGTTATRPTVDGYLERLREAGVLDILGYWVGRTLYDSSVGRTLASELGASAAPRPVLMLQLTSEGTLRPGYEDLRRLLIGAGLDVEVELIQGHENWWFDEERDLRRLGSDGDVNHDASDGRVAPPGITATLVELVTSWLERHLPAEVPA